MTGIHDLAREVGVSTATVSRALRGLPRVSESTRERVLEAAVRLGYVPSPHAVGLASGGQTRSVAIVVPFVTRWYFAAVVHGAEQVLREQGYDLLLYNLAGDSAARHRVLRTQVLTKRVDAVLVVGLGPTAEEIAAMQRQGSPVVTLGARVEEWSSVRIDDVEASRTAMRHLLDLGHRRIAFVGGLGEDGLDFTTPTARLEGYRSSLHDVGLPLDPALELDGRFTLDGGVDCGRAVAAMDQRPTAVFCASDEMAIGLMSALREAGLRVPEDVSVVGVDDHEMARFFDLTTVRQPVHEQGRIAAQQILRSLGGADGPAEVAPEHVELATELVVRATTAAV
ncbi:LacI family DNA-binding transcriptional regulator [Nocardioides kribbensis]|uniref:LacI family DNA-binding transcriptional regulator n=1 Tax=Nocardioides kribbensis TaxID=305517 RepID=UPI0032DAAC65